MSKYLSSQTVDGLLREIENMVAKIETNQKRIKRAGLKIKRKKEFVVDSIHLDLESGWDNR